jgi:hypothetical protein
MPAVPATLIVQLHPGLPFAHKLFVMQRTTPDADATPCDFTGYTAAPLKLRTILEDRDAPPLASVADDPIATPAVTILDQATSEQGKLTIYLSPDDTLAVTATGKAYGEVVLTSPAGLSEVWALVQVVIWPPTSIDPSPAAFDNTQWSEHKAILLRPQSAMSALQSAVTVDGTATGSTTVYTAPTNGVYLRGALLTLTDADTIVDVAEVRFKRVSDGAILAASSTLAALTAEGNQRYITFDGVTPTLAAGDAVACEVVTEADAIAYDFTVRVDRTFI